ncbi:unnamed protein product, partial [Vitis vinifera]
MLQCASSHAPVRVEARFRCASGRLQVASGRASERGGYPERDTRQGSRMDEARFRCPLFRPGGWTRQSECVWPRWVGTWRLEILQFWVNFWVSRFLWWKPFFWIFISRLMLILCFQARLLLETCREYCLEQNPSFYLIFGACLVGFRKLRLVWFLLLCVFLCNFWVWIEELMFEDGNLCIFDEKCMKFWAENFFFLLQNQAVLS